VTPIMLRPKLLAARLMESSDPGNRARLAA
jgi:hypothetical protein